MLPIPYNTDAPIYFFPFVTIGLIVVNTLAFGASLQADPHDLINWILQFGDGFHPVQWITNNFMHADIVHLVGNMFFLWGFGLVVEGKLGWWKFLLVYLAMGTIYGFLIQAVMLGSHGGALALRRDFRANDYFRHLGAKNDMNCFVWFFGPRLIELQMTMFAGAYLVWQIIAAAITKFSMSSAMLHLAGAGVGAVFGVALLKLDLVDCEGWDIFAVWGNREGKRLEPKVVEEKPSKKAPMIMADDHAQFLTNAIKNRLTTGDFSGAALLYQRQRRSHSDWLLNETDLLSLIKAVHQQKLWSESVPAMVDYLHQFPDKATRMRLKLAQILIDADRRPTRALKVLSKVQLSTLPPELETIHKKLIARAEKLQDECDLEVLDGEEW